MKDTDRQRTNEAPTVSVICHTFNHEPFIRQAIESILIQSCDFPIEIIVHDDASTDQTAQIIQEFIEDKVERFVPILQSENQFSQGRRPKQFTYPKAKGEFIALCEGDDYWIDPFKLQKQVNALHRYPDVDLCVHSGLRLSMRTGKARRGFNYGRRERIVPSAEVIARHNQFAPTASILMRRDAALAMPDWWFYESPPPPVGDVFIESIVGRNGVLYLPDAMSVYRRGTPGSYTSNFRESSGPFLQDSLERMLYFTEKLRGMKDVPQEALDQRLSYIRLNYGLQFLAAGDRERFTNVVREIKLDRHRLPLAALRLMCRSRTAFRLGRSSFNFLRRFT